jgi:hypothetical protein
MLEGIEPTPIAMAEFLANPLKHSGGVTKREVNSGSNLPL